MFIENIKEKYHLKDIFLDEKRILKSELNKQTLDNIKLDGNGAPWWVSENAAGEET
jgi:hypothetical protein